MQRAAAEAFLAFLMSPEGQAAYASFGFIPATAQERRINTLEPG
jgi:ABC-type Fe3+ transport system substrate-binding protein